MKKILLATLALSTFALASAPASAQIVRRMCNAFGCQTFVIPIPQQRMMRPMAPMQGYYRNNQGGLFGTGRDGTQHLQTCGRGPTYEQGGSMWCATR